ncbi:DUF3000 domain-containing protein [Timonella sp. A28]|uniref:DUF3000 domain-containing protein n=1 Tax=Timonella sp. A28 TaxID=3442640 RepID=UPI003EBE2DF3
MDPHSVSAPAEFMAALMSLRGSVVRPEISVEEIPAPRGIAPFSVALEGELSDLSLLSVASNVAPDEDFSESDELPVTGKFIVLHDPHRPASWQSDFRVVVLVRAQIDQEIGSDPLLTQVAWSWLNEAFQYCGAEYHNLAGTVTRTVSETLGDISPAQHRAQLEIRASWSPTFSKTAEGIDLDLGPHLSTWSNLLCASIGLPVVAQGFPTLQGERGPRRIVQGTTSH